MKIRGNTVGTTIAPEKVLVKSGNLTEEEKAQARKNIGASAVGEGGGSVEGAVLYTEQELTWQQQEQARTNIGAMKEGSSQTDIQMGLHNIDRVGTVFFGEPKVESEFDIGLCYSGIEHGQDGQCRSVMQFVHNWEIPEPVDIVLRGLSNGIDDSDAATIGQVREMVQGRVETLFDITIEEAVASYSTDVFSQEIVDKLSGAKEIKIDILVNPAQEPYKLTGFCFHSVNKNTGGLGRIVDNLSLDAGSSRNKPYTTVYLQPLFLGEGYVKHTTYGVKGLSRNYKAEFLGGETLWSTLNYFKISTTATGGIPAGTTVKVEVIL